MMQKSPFKFLDSYSKEDRHIFFGRDREINDLYSAVLAGKILLVYGVSGSGKSSLLNCGLANKFNDTDWLHLNIRRGSDINQSLLEGLSRIAITKGPFARTDDSGKRKISVNKAIQSVYLDHFRPVYLIFDQFEELFIFGAIDEKYEFFRNLKSIIDSDIQCRIIISVREEYLAGLTEFERIIPDLFSNRIRIGRMTRLNALEVVEGPCRVSNIEVEKGFADTLLSKLDPESPEVELTYLQVCLDRIYREASSAAGESVKITLNLLERQGELKDLLGSFLEEQVSQLDDPEAGMTLLKAFVSVKGTRQNITEEEAQRHSMTLGRKIEPELIRDLIQTFIGLRILRDKDENGRYELRHDSLAEKIFEKITLVEKELLEVRSFIENAWQNYEKRGVLLNSDDLNYLAPYEDKLFLSEKLTKFIDHSRREVQKKRRRRQNALIISATLLISVLSFFSIWARRERNKAVEQQQIAEKQTIEAFLASARADSAMRSAVLEKNKAEESERQALLAKEEADRARLSAQQARSAALAQKKIAEENAIKADEQARIAQQQKLISDDQRSKADDARKVAERLTLLSTAKMLALQSLQTDINPGLSGINALMAYNLHKNNNGKDDDPIIFSALNQAYLLLDSSKHTVFRGLPYEVKTLYAGQNAVTGADLYGNVIKWNFDGKSDAPLNINPEKSISFIEFNKSGNLLLTGYEDQSAELWSIDNLGKILPVESELQSIGSPIKCADFGLKDEFVATTGWDSLVNVYQTRRSINSSVKSIRTGTIVNDLAFCGDSLIAIAGADGTIIIWNLFNDEKRILTGKNEFIPLSLAWNPEEKTLYAGLSNGSLLLFTESGDEFIRLNLEVHNSGIDRIVFNNDYSMIATSSWDRVVKFNRIPFNLNAGLYTFNPGTAGVLENRIRALCFTAEGDLIASVSDFTLRRWILYTDRLAYEVCKIVNKGSPNCNTGTVIDKD